MANIQSSINQMISLAGLLASQSPTLKEAASKRSKLETLSRRERAVTEARDIASGKNGGAISTKEAEAYQEELQAIKKEQFEVDPSLEAFKAYKEAAPYDKEGVVNLSEDPEKIAQDEIEEEQRREEVEYYKNFYRGTAPESKANDPYAELFRKYGADAYELADTHSQDAQRRLAETRRRNKEVIYGSENDR